MTARDIEIAEAELTDNISEKDESTKDGNAGGVRGDLAIPRDLQQKEIADTRTRQALLAKGRRNSTIRMMKRVTRTCTTATIRAKQCTKESRLAMVLSS